MKWHLRGKIGVFGLIGIAAVNACLTAGGSEPAGKKFDGRIGLQLYSLRDQFKQDVPGTLDKVKGFGIKYVELATTYGLPPEQFKAELEKRGLTAIAGHYPFERFRDDVEGLAKEVQALGMKYAGCAWIPHQGDFSEKTCRETAAVFNRAGEALAKHGIKFYYHTHGYEFQPHGNGTLFDLLMSETNPKFVAYEMDIFWIAHAGQDPARLLGKYGKRWELIHLKDMKKGTPTGLLTGGTDVKNDVALGTGQIDLPATLRAARMVGAKYYFIEDESPSSEQQIPVSLRYLEQVRL
jgi:sugar phosphate isomerase/epimerase